ncbi:MAG: DUF2786 domain-containing protein [Acidimicrobiales bacterium]
MCAGTRSATSKAGEATVNDRDTAVRRARALRAKAESTGYDSEAEAGLAKADDLIAGWAIHDSAERSGRLVVRVTARPTVSATPGG